MSNQDEEEARHLLHQQYERPEQQSYASDDITAAVAGIRSRLDTLASINADNILHPRWTARTVSFHHRGGIRSLGLIETQVDELRTELEYQHKRLDEIRDAALAGEQKES